MPSNYQEAGFRLGHRPALDGLRGIFVLLVVAIHGGIPFMQGAGLGVDGFFVLSGFLITCLLLQERQRHGAISLKLFYARRALRLLPALYAFLVAFTILRVLFLDGEVALATERGIVLSFLYTSNWHTEVFGSSSVGLSYLNHTWSLAIEEQFYLVWPLILIGLLSLRLSAKWLALCIGSLAMASALWRLWLAIGGSSAARLFLGSDVRADALLVGCTLGALTAGGVIRPTEGGARWTRGLAVGAVGVLAYLVVMPEWYSNMSPYYGVFTLIAICAALLILHLVVSPNGYAAKALAWGPLAKVGVVSYGVYLWHYPIFNLVRPGEAGWLDLPVQMTRLALTAFFVVVSYRYVEQPMLRLKERLSSKASDNHKADSASMVAGEMPLLPGGVARARAE